MTSTMPITPVLFATAGLLAGAGARLLLRRLRRGTRVPPPWCELGVALAWAGVGTAAGIGAVPCALGAPAARPRLARGRGGRRRRAGRRLPDALTLPALPVALLLLVPVGGSAVWRGVLGAAVAAVAHLVVHLAAPTALGAGDVKLSAPLGAALGAASWEALVVAGLLAALFSGALAATVLVARGRARSRAARPVDAPGRAARHRCRCAGAVSCRPRGVAGSIRTAPR